MNSSKKIKVKTNHVEVKKEEKPIPKPLIYVSAVLIVILIASVLFDQLYERTLMTINGDKYKLDDMSFYFYSVESQYESYNQMFGGQYWDMTFDEASGTTVRDMAKQEAIQTALYTEILYKEAVENGYELTEEEKATVDTNVTKLLDDGLTEEVIEKNNYDKTYLTDIISKSTLVERFRQDKIATLNIDEAAITEGISKEEYRQYDIEYFFIANSKTDDQGTSTPLTEDEKKAAYDKLASLIDKAKTTEDWSTLVSEDEEDLTYQENYFTKSDTKFDEEFEAIMMAMNNGDISDIYETENGYYLVRMVNNNSTESYDKAVADAIAKAEDEGFQKLYNEISDTYDFSINNKAIKPLRMGQIALP